MNSSSFDRQLTENSESISFQHEHILRRGATSECFKVRIFGKWHFIKRPKKEFTSNPIYIAAFDKEFDLGYNLDHPHIVKYISKGIDKIGKYICSEYIDGLTLTEFIVVNSEFYKNKNNMLKFAQQLFSALSYLHSHQIVHLDLKPDNILITRNGNNIKIIDLGMSYSDCYTDITGGTVHFSSPEQFSNSTSISYKNDMYAAGKVLLYAINAGTTTKYSNIIPYSLNTIIKHCTTIDHKKRTITANDCLELLNKKHTSAIIHYSILFTATTISICLLFYFSSVNPTTGNTSGSINKSVETNKNTLCDTNQIKSYLKINNKISRDINLHSRKKNSILENKITVVIRNRLEPNLTSMNQIYSSINEFNYDVLLRGYNNWKELCTSDCKYLYNQYKDSISYSDFEKIYIKELNIFNKPIEMQLESFKSTASSTISFHQSSPKFNLEETRMRY